ncbi:DUF3795 domain-containing protein [Clostridium uliginosum]|uniref:DUF3795 domain-containing protein n=1 Tax=Clostridium uliginosum TaxID=119641 RepID=A0A1I1P148_9CLOT|nr:DUF3795 domain-containing protein [Clostridium uliginosum]SFD03455.1 Protein of unknown function [Clostridium uliginosum]
MFESRCGVCCNSCKRKEKVNCAGCTNISVPFWGGSCKVKSCCETKGLNHCGVCDEFPCDMLSNMGKDQGYDSAPRLNQCKKWANKTTSNKHNL